MQSDHPSCGASRAALLVNGTLAETEAHAQSKRDETQAYLVVYVCCSLYHVVSLVASSFIWAYGGVRASGHARAASCPSDGSAGSRAVTMSSASSRESACCARGCRCS